MPPQRVVVVVVGWTVCLLELFNGFLSSLDNVDEE